MSKIMGRSTQNSRQEMKQSPSQEAKKPEQQKNNELCNFIKNAFCADGEVLAIKKKFESEICFEVTDSKRGVFYVAFSKTK